MIAETVAIDLVCDAGDFVPGFAAVRAAVYGEVNCWRFWTVVFPGCEKDAVFEEHCSCVEGFGGGVVGWRVEDGDGAEGAEGLEDRGV